MTDPMELAKSMDRFNGWPGFLSIEEARLIAAALRLAEADAEVIDHDDGEPISPKDGEMTKWSEERDVLIERRRDAEDAYLSAREAAR